MSARGPGEGWERLFWAVFERSSNGIALLDDQRRFVAINDAAVALLGRTRRELLGIPIFELMSPSERAHSERQWHAFLRAGEYFGARTFLRPDGSEMEVEFAASWATVTGRRLAVYVAIAPSNPLPSIKPGTGPERMLTPREREVVTLIALGHATPDIAKQLFISEATVRTHVRNAMAKLGARTRAQLVATVLGRIDVVHPPSFGRVTAR